MNKEIFYKSKTLLEAMQYMSKHGLKSLVIVDQENKLFGTITDGDIRRHLINGGILDVSIENICNTSCRYFYKEHLREENIEEYLKINDIDFIPILSKEDEVVEIYRKGKKTFGKIDDVGVLIMAGGKGTRMHPFTSVLPKPLIPIGGSTILEQIIQIFTKHLIDNFHISVNFKSKIIKSFFEEMAPSYSVSFLEEEKPLGTAGALKLYKGKEDLIFVINCDVMFDLDLTDIISEHTNNNFDITLVCAKKEYQIPYGTVLKKNKLLEKIEEKPLLQYLINTGFYLINSKIIELIKSNEKIDFTDLVSRAKDNNLSVGIFEINDNCWNDIGQWKEYKDTLKKISINE